MIKGSYTIIGVPLLTKKDLKRFIKLCKLTQGEWMSGDPIETVCSQIYNSDMVSSVNLHVEFENRPRLSYTAVKLYHFSFPVS
jgi:hypothetical protein